MAFEVYYLLQTLLQMAAIEFYEDAIFEAETQKLMKYELGYLILLNFVPLVILIKVIRLEEVASEVVKPEQLTDAEAVAKH